jgi:hypothetical protein
VIGRPDRADVLGDVELNSIPLEWEVYSSLFLFLANGTTAVRWIFGISASTAIVAQSAFIANSILISQTVKSTSLSIRSG